MCRDDCILLFLTYLWSWTPLWVAEARQQTCARHWPAAWCSLGRRRGHPGCPSSPNCSWRLWQVLLNSCWSWRVGKYPERVWFHHHHRPILRQNFGAAWQQACLYGPVALGPDAWCPSDQLCSQTKNSTQQGWRALHRERRCLILKHEITIRWHYKAFPQLQYNMWNQGGHKLLTATCTTRLFFIQLCHC